MHVSCVQSGGEKSWGGGQRATRLDFIFWPNIHPAMEASYSVEASKIIEARPQDIWDTLVDYQEAHPKILPKAFQDYRVEAGGRGAGTRLSLTLRMGGRAMPLRMVVSEPEPGRRLREELEDGTVTEFHLAPMGTSTEVSIRTVWPRKPGLGGWLEAKVAPRMAAKLYHEELANLQTYLRSKA